MVCRTLWQLRNLTQSLLKTLDDSMHHFNSFKFSNTKYIYKFDLN